MAGLKADHFETLLSMTCLACFLIQLRTICARVVPPTHVVLALQRKCIVGISTSQSIKVLSSHKTSKKVKNLVTN